MERERIIPYLPNDLNHPQPLVDEIRQRRGGELLHLDRMLLHSPALATGWNTMLGQIRHHLSVSMKLRELIMCAIAILNEAEYEYYQHAPVYLSSTVGGREEELVVLREKLSLITVSAAASAAYSSGDSKERYVTFDRSIFTEIEECVIALTIQMTRDIHVDPSLMSKLDEALGHQQVVELVGVIAAYNMVSRFLVALNISQHDCDNSSNNEDAKKET